MIKHTVSAAEFGRVAVLEANPNPQIADGRPIC